MTTEVNQDTFENRTISTKIPQPRKRYVGVAARRRSRAAVAAGSYPRLDRLGAAMIVISRCLIAR